MTKEWMKTRRAFIVCLCVALFFTIYALLGINRVTATHGVEHIWLIMLMKDQTFIDAIKYVPLLCGLIIGLAQMMPEMQLYRLKLTLHLPVPVSRLLLTFTSLNDSLAYPRIDNFSWRALPLNVVLALILLLLPHYSNKRWGALLTLPLGIYAFIPFLLFRD